MYLCENKHTVHMSEYICNAAIVVVEHKSDQAKEPWEKGQRRR